MSKSIPNKFDPGCVSTRISDCQGAVHVAIDGLLTDDPETISAAVGGLCVVERELADIAAHIEATRDAQARI